MYWYGRYGGIGEVHAPYSTKMRGDVVRTENVKSTYTVNCTPDSLRGEPIRTAYCTALRWMLTMVAECGMFGSF
jgi:hypothetical protein